VTDDLGAPIIDVVHRSMALHPRSLQKRIGPSEIGVGCDIALLHKLNGDPEPDRGPAWKPAIGTAVHTQLETWFNAENVRLGRRRWYTEQRVDVGELDGQPITGSMDLFDVDTMTVWDFKVVGPKALTGYRANGPSRQYRIQAHLYGLGWLRDPDTTGVPDRVGIAFLPRDGELSRAYFWSEEWDPTVGLDALDHLQGLAWQLREVGIDLALSTCTPCDGPFCPWCPALRVGTVGLMSVPA
jgi:hypothetical protein